MNILRRSLIVALSFAVSTSWAGKDLSQLAAGEPNHKLNGKLAPEQYVMVDVVRLKNPKLLWVNLPLLREMGYDVPDVLDAATEHKILDALGWVSNDRVVSPDDVILNDRRTFEAEFYGGEGLGINTGSARAASVGDVQVKGVGITEHLKHYDAKHTARSTVHESIKDAIWGEVLNNELPFGANRLVAILDRGGQLENGEPQALEVRVDPIRMGHFIPRTYGSDAADVERATKAANLLENNLPVPENGFPAGASRGQKVIMGMEEYARRVGIQYGQLFMRRILHGATSQSNIEINGRMIDFGTASAQPGYEQIKFLEHVAPFGDTEELTRVLMKSFASMMKPDQALEQDLREAAGQSSWRAAVANRLEETFLANYNAERRRMALRFTGVPELLVDSLIKNHESLAKQLVSMTDAELMASQPTNVGQKNTLKNGDTGRLQRILEAIHSSNGPIDEVTISEAIEVANGAKKAVTPPRRWYQVWKSNSQSPSALAAADAKLAKELAAWFDDAQKLAETKGLQAPAFRKLVAENSRFLNRPMQDLYLPDLKAKTIAVTKAYMAGNKTAAATAIQDLVTTSIRSIQGLSWSQAPVRILAEAGKAPKAEIYDALTDSKKIVDVKNPDRHFKKAKAVRAGVNRCEAVFY